MNLLQIFSLSYLLDKSPNGDFLFGFVLLAFFLLITFIGSIMQNPAKKDKYLKKSLRKKLWIFPYLGGIGIILVLARFAAMPLFSMRIILLIVVLINMLMLIITFYKVHTEYYRRKKSALREAKKREKNI